MSAIEPEAIHTLVRMANQIGLNFRAHPHDRAVASIAEHIRLFWTPKMRRDIIAYLTANGSGLDPLTQEAIELLRN